MPVGHIWKFDLVEYKIRGFGMKFNFQKFELSLSCSVFSRQLKTSKKNQNDRVAIAGKRQKKQREIAIRNFRDKNKNTRVELSYLDIGDRVITKEDRNSVEPG